MTINTTDSEHSGAWRRRTATHESDAEKKRKLIAENVRPGDRPKVPARREIAERFGRIVPRR